MDDHTIVGSIYDCAANPELWPSTLVAIRDHLRSDFVMAGFADMSPLDQQQSPTFVFHNSPWDVEWLMRLKNCCRSYPSTSWRCRSMPPQLLDADATHERGRIPPDRILPRMGPAEAAA